MRANTSLRSAFRFGMMMVAASGVTFAASQAHADTATAGGANSSTGNAALKFDYNQALPTSIDTGYFGPSVAQVKALLKIEPVKDGGPLYSIDMPKGAVLEASWSNDKKIVLKASNGSQTDGTIKVRHTLTPSMELKVVVPVINQTVILNFDATKYVNKLPGARFNFDSRATQAFAPWGFTAVDAKLNAPDLDNSVLFSQPLTVFDNILDPEKWAGQFGVRATTKPTFSYKTTKVMLSGTNAPLTSGAGEAIVDAIDGDYMEVMASVEGEMKVVGQVEFQPYLTITKALGYNFGTNLAFTAYKKDYTVPAQKVAFQASLVHIALPNVHAPKEGIDLGDVKAGGSATKTVTIDNSGELAATMSFKSSDPAFQVPGDTVTVPPKSKYEMQIKFSANNAGAASADITVVSNDPDSPEQLFKIGANGADVGKGGEDADLPGSAPSADSGCGCKTAGTTTSTGGWAGIGLLALGITIAARRRRTNTPA
jgi:MYXO-CTERM domain-containing protein